ncbi:hypothetical protein [Longitalea luteola]|uniref:hypothetical protein n=1 Tax=Longitalea luteola TaxID=2812563 RepID=UPI001A97877B|nr:hypothetical protein [Longitalea luteola]
MLLRKKFPLLLPMLAALCFASACSKSSSNDTNNTPPPDTGTEQEPEQDYSNCLLSEVNYGSQLNSPFHSYPFTLAYDSLKRVSQLSGAGEFNVYNYETGKIIKTTYINSIALINMVARYVYTLDNNGRIVSNTTASYNRPASIDAYTRQDKTMYEYNSDGYLIGEKIFAYGSDLMQERKFTYQAGNLVQRENIHYALLYTPGVKIGADTITYTYDNAPLFPEAVYLHEVTDVKTGKPNKNNVTAIQLKMFDGTGGIRDYYRSIQYTYAVRGKRLDKVTMAASTVKGISINDTISFKYKCD